MPKKKINPSDLDLTPKAVGGSRGKTAPDETNELHCTPTEMTICVSGVDCFQSNYTLCEDDSLKCAGTIACPPTNNCVDSRSAAVQCCAHTGIDCAESGNNCQETNKTCTCLVRTDDCPATENNLCNTTTICQTENGTACPASVILEECPETLIHCGTTITTGPPLTSNPCNEYTNDNCEESNKCQFLTTLLACK